MCGGRVGPVDKSCCYFVELSVMTVLVCVLPRAANWRLSEGFCAEGRLDRVAPKRETKRYNFIYLNVVTLINSINLTYVFIQGVPLATEPGVSLIILTPLKILQRNLNSSAFFSFTFLTQ